MVEKQGTLIYINEENRTEADFMSHNFIKREEKNRAYINTLGAEALMNFLALEKFDFSNTHSIHSISRILGMIDISDIILPNIHIDVRVVFDENQIFIPKTHFELDIKPDIYVVLKLGPKFEYFELLGYFEPSIINTKNQNSEYYFVEKSSLTSAEALVSFIRHYNRTFKNISETQMLKGRELSVSLADHDISFEELKLLMNLLINSDTLRDSVMEYDNFETLSSRAVVYLNSNNNKSENSEEETKLESDFQNEEKNDESSDEENVSEAVIDIDDSIDDEIQIDEDMLDVSSEDIDSSEENLEEDISIEDNESEGIAEGEPTDLVSDEAIELAGMAADTLDEVKDNIVEQRLTEQYGALDNIDLDKVDPGVEIPDNINDGVIIPDEDILSDKMIAQGDNDEALPTNIEDLESVEPDETYYELLEQQQNSTFNIEDLPQSEDSDFVDNIDETTDINELSPVEAAPDVEIFDEATNIEDLSPIEKDDKYEENTDLLVDDMSQIDIAGSQAADDIKSDDNANIDDMDLSGFDLDEEQISNEEDSFVNDAQMIDNSIELDDDTSIPEDLSAEDLLDDSTAVIEETVSDNLNENILNEIENKQNEADYFSFGEDDSAEPEEVFDLTNDESWDQISDISNEFEPDSSNEFGSSDDIPVELNSGEEFASFDEIRNKKHHINTEVNDDTVSISNSNFNPGEIPIGINTGEDKSVSADAENLENLYNESENLNNTMLSNPARLTNKKNKQKGMSVGVILAGGLLVFVLIAVIGLSVMRKAGLVKATQPVADNMPPATAPVETTVDAPERNLPPRRDDGNSNIVNMDEPASKVAAVAPTTPPKQLSETAYISVSKLSWEIPDYVMANADFKRYFQSSGKSLKSALSSDLLLATDYIYTKQVRLSVTFDKTGMFKESRIVMSSGSTQVDNIVLQSVNQTLKVLKAPNSLGNDENTTVVLKIYF